MRIQTFDRSNSFESQADACSRTTAAWIPSLSLTRFVVAILPRLLSVGPRKAGISTFARSTYCKGAREMLSRRPNARLASKMLVVNPDGDERLRRPVMPPTARSVMPRVGRLQSAYDLGSRTTLE